MSLMEGNSHNPLEVLVVGEPLLPQTDGQNLLDGQGPLPVEGVQNPADVEGEEHLSVEGVQNAADVEGEEPLSVKGDQNPADVEGEEHLSVEGVQSAADVEGEEHLSVEGVQNPADVEGEEHLPEEGGQNVAEVEEPRFLVFTDVEYRQGVRHETTRIVHNAKYYPDLVLSLLGTRDLEIKDD